LLRFGLHLFLGVSPMLRSAPGWHSYLLPRPFVKLRGQKDIRFIPHAYVAATFRKDAFGFILFLVLCFVWQSGEAFYQGRIRLCCKKASDPDSPTGE
jgi:hypothetical protein